MFSLKNLSKYSIHHAICKFYKTLKAGTFQQCKTKRIHFPSKQIPVVPFPGAYLPLLSVERAISCDTGGIIMKFFWYASLQLTLVLLLDNIQTILTSPHSRNPKFWLHQCNRDILYSITHCITLLLLSTHSCLDPV